MLISTKKRKSNKGNTVVENVYGPNPKRGSSPRRRRPKGCLAAGTKVWTPSGYAAIETFKPGDMVMSFANGLTSIQPVLKVHRYLQREVFEIELGDNGAVIRATGSHSFSTDRGWLTVDNLRPGDLVHVLGHGSIQPKVVTRVVQTSESVDVFNLLTAGSHTYVAEGVVTHNFSYLRTIRTFLHNYLFDPIRSRVIAAGQSSRRTPGVTLSRAQP